MLCDTDVIIFKMKNKFKLSILTNNDIPWDLPLWYETIKNLKNDFDLSGGIFVFPDRIKPIGDGIKVPLWYLKIYGIKNFFLLSIFAIVRYSKFVIKTGVYNFESLGRHFDIPVYFFEDPNSKVVIEKIKKDKVDIGLILLTHILKKEILDIEGIDFINMHGGRLPQCGGVMPYLYSRIYDIRPTLTFYKVDKNINSGLIIKELKYKDEDASMVKYYKDVFKKYPKVISKVIEKLLREKDSLKEIKQSRLFSYPDKEKFQKYTEKDFKIIEFSDIYRSK